MMTGPAAGHAFVHGLCACGRRWMDIMHCDEGCVGLDGYAHMGALNETELVQIRTLKAKQDAIMADALGLRKREAASA